MANTPTNPFEKIANPAEEAQEIKEKLDQARLEVEAAQRQGDLTRASELTYGVIPA